MSQEFQDFRHGAEPSKDSKAKKAFSRIKT